MNEWITISFVPQQVITWVIIGLIAGLFAGLIIRGRGIGFAASVVVGLLGAVLGGFLFSLLRVQLPAEMSGGLTLPWADIFVAFVGAVLVLLIFGGFYRRRMNYQR